MEWCVSQPVPAGVSFPRRIVSIHFVPRPARRRAAGRQATRDAMRESDNHSRSGRGVWTAVATVAVSALALTGRAASHRAAGVSDQSSSLGAGRSRRGGWRERHDAWRPEEDRLAAAMRADPVYHRYLPTIYPGFDVNSDDWWHKPRGEVPSSGAANADDAGRDFDLPGLPPRRAGIPSTNDHRPGHGRPEKNKNKNGKKNQFKVCLDNGAGSWDVAFAKGIDNLFHPGVCFGAVEQNDCHASADVVIFNEHDFIWGGAHRNAARGGRIELPEKAHPSQVYVYFAHEAAGGFGAELRDTSFTSQFDYLSYVDRRRSAMWWPFGPSLRSLTDDFDVFRKRREERVPAIAWLATDCVEPRASILRSIADAFPVFSMGECLRNAPPPHGLPERGAVDPASHASFQRAMSDYMFYFAAENAGACDGYATEKVWMALSRGSVPLYFGTDDVYDLLPDRDAIVDLRKFDSVDAVARKLRAIATDDSEWAKAHAWRFRDPSTWPRGFRELLRATSTDVKYGVCDVLMKGPRGYRPSRERPRQARCDAAVKVLGRKLGGMDGGWGGYPYARGGESGGALRAPTEHLHRRCGAATGACWSLSRPGEGGKGGKGGRG